MLSTWLLLVVEVAVEHLVTEALVVAVVVQVDTAVV